MTKLNLDEINKIDWTSSTILDLQLKYTTTCNFYFEIVIEAHIDGSVFKFEIDNSNLETKNIPYDFDYVIYSKSELNIGGVIFKIFNQPNFKSEILFYRLT